MKFQKYTLIKQRPSFYMWGFVLFSSLFGLMLTSYVAEAVSYYDPAATLGLTSVSLMDVVLGVIQWILGLMGLVAVIMILYGGFLYMTSRGDENKIDRAKQIISSALIGLAIVLLAWAIVSMVFHVIAIVTTPGGDTDPGDGTDPGGPTATIPFYFQSIATSCENPNDTYRDDLYQCSGIAIHFNEPIDTGTFMRGLIPEGSTIDDEAGNIRVERCSDNSEAGCSNLATAAISPAVEVQDAVYAGGIRDGEGPQWTTSRKTISFYHAGEEFLFQKDQWYRLIIPKEVVESADGNRLDERACDMLDPANQCEYKETGLEDVYVWPFRVGNKNDVTAPTLETSTPIVEGEEAFPSRNITRQHLLWYEFNEAIDPTTAILDSNVVIRPIDMTSYSEDQLQAPDTSTPPYISTDYGLHLGTPIDPSNYTIHAEERGIIVEFESDFLMDPFQWYEITVKDLEDLCQNAINPITTRFQTNNVTPGVEAISPSNGYEYACPDIIPMITFTVSMYDPSTGTCAPGSSYVKKETESQIVDSGNVDSGRAITVLPSNDYPGAGDYNNYCKTYQFNLPPELEANESYSVGVRTKKVLNSDGDLLEFGSVPPLATDTTSEGDWNFDVKQPGQCVNPPFIHWVDPEKGPKGQCFTIRGNDFDSRPNDSHIELIELDGSGIPTGVEKRADITAPGAWNDNYIIAEIPQTVSAQKHQVQVIMDYPGPIGELVSNTKDFTVESGSFSGPCLYSIYPESSEIDFDRINADGTRFMDGADTTVQEVIYDPGGPSRTVIPADSSWSDTHIFPISVPDVLEPVSPNTSRETSIKLKNDKGTSNSLPFTVIKPVPGQPRLINKAPVCAAACPNSEPFAEFSTNLLASTVSTTTAKILKCDNECQDGDGLTDIGSGVILSGGVITFTPGILEEDTYYRVYISENVKSDPWQLAISGLNFDIDNNRILDGISWIFGVKDNRNQCDTLAYTETLPVEATIFISPDSEGYVGKAFVDTPECEYGQEPVNPAPYEWTWGISSDPSSVIAGITSDPASTALESMDHYATVTSDSDLEGSLTAIIQGIGGGKASAAKFSVEIDPLSCTEDKDCILDGCVSTCDITKNLCRPKITKINGKETGTIDRAIGGWVTIEGCYFDSKRGSVYYSPTITNPNVEGSWPSIPQCNAALWTNTKIISEVPEVDTADTIDDAQSGPLLVERNRDRETVISSQTINITTQRTPDICLVDPNRGYFNEPKEVIDIYGQNFSRQIPGVDSVLFSGDKVSESEASEYDEWQETHIQTYVPVGTTLSSDVDTPGYVKVKKGPQSSVSDFLVIPEACGCSVGNPAVSCTALGQAGKTCSTKTIGNQHCCYAPLTASLLNTSPFCRNGIIEIEFSDKVDVVSAEAGTVLTDSSGAIIPAKITMENDATLMLIEPVEVLNPVEDYTVTLKKDDPKTGEYEGIITHTGVSFAFEVSHILTTKADLCAVERVQIDKKQASGSWEKEVYTDYFHCSGNTCDGDINTTTDGNQHTFKARARDKDDMMLSATYTWSKVNKQGDIIETPTPTNRSETSVTAKNDTGRAILIARALGVPQPEAGNAEAVVDIQSDFCEAPWKYTDTEHNYDLYYCAGNDPLDLLYRFSNSDIHVSEFAVTTDGNDDLMKQIFFTKSGVDQSGAIGIRLYQNEQNLTPEEWYKKNIAKDRQGAIAEETVGGYPSVREGTSSYILYPNVVGADDPYVNIMVLSYSADAPEDIKNIYAQIKKNLIYAINVNSTFGLCTGNPTYKTATECIARDTNRIIELSSLQRRLSDYHDEKNFYPKLEIGSYFQGVTMSKWPSWNSELGKEIKYTPPTDPYNDFAPECKEVDIKLSEETCYYQGENDPTNRYFQCPVETLGEVHPDDSHTYWYKFIDNDTIELYTNLEIQHEKGWVTTGYASPYNPCDGLYPGTACSCYNYKRTITP